jgi:hypothetical protein
MTTCVRWHTRRQRGACPKPCSGCPESGVYELRGRGRTAFRMAGIRSGAPRRSRIGSGFAACPMDFHARCRDTRCACATPGLHPASARASDGALNEIAKGQRDVARFVIGARKREQQTRCRVGREVRPATCPAFHGLQRLLHLPHHPKPRERIAHRSGPGELMPISPVLSRIARRDNTAPTAANSSCVSFTSAMLNSRDSGAFRVSKSDVWCVTRVRISCRF